MSGTILVNASTSVVLIDTSQIINAVVMLPSVNPGQTVTIRDSIGYLSTPNKITISTVGGVNFADGTNTVTIQNPFGYLTVTSRDTTSWNLVNSFGFPQNRSVASVDSLTTNWITTSSLYASQSVGTSYLTAVKGLFSTLDCSGQGQFSTLVIGAPYIPLPGIDLTVYGSMDVSQNAVVGGSLTVLGPMTTGSMSTGAIQGTSLTLAGGLTMGGNISAANAAMTANIITASTANITQVTTSSISGLYLNTGIATTGQITTSSLTISSLLTIQGLTITPVQSTMVFSAPLTIPSLTTDYVNVTTKVVTSNLHVDRSILAPNLSLLQLYSTQILNPSGYLVISSISGDTVLGNSISTNTIEAQNLTASNIVVSGNIVQSAPGYIMLNTALMSSLSTQTLYGGTIQAATFAVNNISVQNLDITGSFTGSTLTSLYIPNAALTASTITASTITSANVNTSSLTLGSGLIQTASTIVLTASTVSMSSISTNTFETGILTTSSLTATNLILGAPIDSTLRGPYFICTGSTNCVITGGPGDYYTPLFLSNVKPANYVPNTPYTVGASFQYIIPTAGGTLPGNEVAAQNSLFWGNELNTTSFLTINNAFGAISMYGYYAEDQTSNTSIIYQNTSLNPTAFNWSATMINDSATTLTLQTTSNANYSLVDPNVYINMQNGVLKWDYALNATTIRNSLNDISTRNLLYYGSLKFVSDPKLKQDIQPANLRRCYDIIRDLPLHRYEFIDSYVSTFQVTDRRRLGIMADEYEQVFPKSVTVIESPVPGLSTIKTVDTQQLDMAHLGATQYLLKEIAELRDQVDMILSKKRDL